MTEKEAETILMGAPSSLLEAAAILTERQQVEGGYVGGSSESGSWWADSASDTLYELAKRFRSLKSK